MNANALLSGLSAAAASTFGKLSGLPEFENYHLVRILFFILMLLSNGCVWTFYAKALQKSSSLVATVISAATNYLLSAICGFVLFGELTSILWWSGATLILTGIFIVITEDVSNKLKT